MRKLRRENFKRPRRQVIKMDAAVKAKAEKLFSRSESADCGCAVSPQDF
jgi:hypothetical protein